MPPPLPSSSPPASSPSSFVTATASPSHPRDVTTTDFSSPAEAAPGLPFRNARQLPSELREHCQIYLEENVHRFALAILNNVSSSSGRARTAGNGTFCPPPNQLALLATMAIHPDFTTRPREAPWSEVSRQSLVYLRHALNTFGPVNGRFKDAFRFDNGPRWSRGGSPDSDAGYDDLNGGFNGGSDELAGKYWKDGLWRRGQDFFGVVGWAFNCSVLYPNRWRYWHSWLEFMLELLEEDLTKRHHLDLQAEASRGDGDKEERRRPMLEDSILASYMAQRSSRMAGLKWVMEAVFADGSKKSSSLFQEIWNREHKEASHNANNKRKREKVDLDKGDFGGWLDDESVYSSQPSEPPTPQKALNKSGKVEITAPDEAYLASIPLRQRFFTLLSFFYSEVPRLANELPDLYESFENGIKSQPLSIFSAFINTSASTLIPEAQTSIFSALASRFVATAAPKPKRIDREADERDGISAIMLEKCFLPFPANTISVEDNAKFSLVLENILVLRWLEQIQGFSEDLMELVERGVEARETKCKKKSARGRRKAGVTPGIDDDPDAEARLVLEGSGERLVQLVSLIQSDAFEETSEMNLDDKQMNGEDDRMETMGGNADEDIEPSFMTARSS